MTISAFLERVMLSSFCSKGENSHPFSGGSYARTPLVLGRGMRSLAPYVLCIIIEREKERGRRLLSR